MVALLVVLAGCGGSGNESTDNASDETSSADDSTDNTGDDSGDESGDDNDDSEFSDLPSPGRFLKDEKGVPVTRTEMPRGVEAIGALPARSQPR